MHHHSPQFTASLINPLCTHSGSKPVLSLEPNTIWCHVTQYNLINQSLSTIHSKLDQSFLCTHSGSNPVLSETSVGVFHAQAQVERSARLYPKPKTLTQLNSFQHSPLPESLTKSTVVEQLKLTTLFENELSGFAGISSCGDPTSWRRCCFHLGRLRCSGRWKGVPLLRQESCATSKCCIPSVLIGGEFCSNT